MATTNSARFDSVEHTQTALATLLATLQASVATLSTKHAFAAVAMSSMPIVASSATMVTTFIAVDDVMHKLDKYS